MSRLLVLAETYAGHIAPGTLTTISFAQQWKQASGGEFDILVLVGGAIADLESIASLGACKILQATSPELENPTAGVVASIIKAAIQGSGATSLAGPSSSFGRDVLPRTAAVLGLPMISNVMSVEASGSGVVFRRPTYAGNVIATVAVEGDNGVFSVRGTSFAAPQAAPSVSPVEALSVPANTGHDATFVQLDAPEQTRPDLTAARVVVSGGRPLRDPDTFERILGGLADKLGGAVGATRAAVDSGIAPNELQVGQTGKVVAPELYIAAGVSGSVQHLAGMKESKVIVAINTDSEAPIFDVATYGLVADLYQAVPELTSKL